MGNSVISHSHLIQERTQKYPQISGLHPGMKHLCGWNQNIYLVVNIMMGYCLSSYQSSALDPGHYSPARDNCLTGKTTASVLWKPLLFAVKWFSCIALIPQWALGAHYRPSKGWYRRDSVVRAYLFIRTCSYKFMNLVSGTLVPQMCHMVSKSKSKKCLFIVDKNTTQTLVTDTIKST